ncbi:MAG: hypothetical protein ACRCV9_16545 [Burkholderiaceae bacterium]
MQRPGALRSTALTVAQDAALAHAQLVMRETLLSMDMSLCSTAVQYLIAWWVPELTRQGYAVLTTAGGLAMTSAPGVLPAGASLSLPADAVVQDYRINVAAQR